MCILLGSCVFYSPRGRHAACVLRPSPSVLDLLWPRGLPSTRCRTTPSRPRRSSWAGYCRLGPLCSGWRPSVVNLVKCLTCCFSLVIIIGINVACLDLKYECFRLEVINFISIGEIINSQQGTCIYKIK